MASGGAGGDDELQGFVEYTFFRPDGSQLGTQGECVVFSCFPYQPADKDITAHCAWLQDCKSTYT